MSKITIAVWKDVFGMNHLTDFAFIEWLKSETAAISQASQALDRVLDSALKNSIDSNFFYCPRCQRSHDGERETIPEECWEAKRQWHIQQTGKT